MCTHSHQTQPKLPLKRVTVSVAPTHCTSVSTTRAFPTTIHVLVIPHSSVMHTVRDTENLPFSADTPHWFSEGCRAAIRGNTRIVSAAMRGRSADLYNAESADERESLRTQSKTGIGCWSSILAVTLPLRDSLHWSAILSFAKSLRIYIRTC